LCRCVVSRGCVRSRDACGNAQATSRAEASWARLDLKASVRCAVLLTRTLQRPQSGNTAASGAWRRLEHGRSRLRCPPSSCASPHRQPSVRVSAPNPYPRNWPNFILSLPDPKTGNGQFVLSPAYIFLHPPS